MPQRYHRFFDQEDNNMCVRTAFWDDSEKKLPEKSARNFSETPDLQISPNRRSLPPVLEGGLDFIKGAFGIKPSVASKAEG